MPELGRTIRMRNDGALVQQQARNSQMIVTVPFREGAEVEAILAGNNNRMLGTRYKRAWTVRWDAVGRDDGGEQHTTTKIDKNAGRRMSN